MQGCLALVATQHNVNLAASSPAWMSRNGLESGMYDRRERKKEA